MHKPSPAQVAYHIGSALKHKAVVMGLLLGVCKALIKRGLVHDLSKFSHTEIQHYAPIVPLLSKIPYGTPEYMEAVAEMKAGVTHHYQNNDHHPEYWGSGVQEMPPLALIEMLVDWKAASLRRGSTPEEFRGTIRSSAGRFVYGEILINQLMDVVEELGW